jgi:hypothetical protein
MGDPFRRSLSAVIAVLTIGLSIAVPVMERGSLVGGTAIESRHDDSRCAHAHDHRVCTQVGANLSITAANADPRSARLVVRVALPVDVPSVDTSSTLEGPPSRAPPLA